MSPMRSNPGGVGHCSEHSHAELNGTHEKYFTHRDISTASPDRARNSGFEKLLCALDKELFVTLQRVAVEVPIPGASLFGVECHITRKDDGDSSVPTTSINLTRTH